MAKRTFKAGATSQSVDVFIPDSSSTTGAGLSGLAYNTSGLKCYYRKGATGTPTAVTLATQTVGGAYSSGGFVELDATNMKGAYRFDIPDTVLASTPYATLYFYGATNMAPVPVELEIVSYDPFDAVRLGLTALPNATAGANGGLPLAVDASGRVDVLKVNGTSQTARDLGASVLISSGTGTGQLDVTSGVVKANATQFAGATVAATTSVTFPAASTVATTTGAVGSVTGAVGSVTGNVGGNVTGSVGSVTGDVGGNVVGSVASVTAGVTVSTNNDKTGYALSSAGVQAIWDALTAALTTASSIGKLLVDNLNATVSSRLASASISLSGGAVTVGTNNDKTGYSMASGGIGSGAHAAAELNAIADAVLDRNMATGTDSGTDSTTTRTPRQALRALRNKTAIAAGTMTVTKEDDSTASWTAAVTTTAGNPVSAVDPT